MTNNIKDHKLSFFFKKEKKKKKDEKIIKRVTILFYWQIQLSIIINTSFLSIHIDYLSLLFSWKKSDLDKQKKPRKQSSELSFIKHEPIAILFLFHWQHNSHRPPILLLVSFEQYNDDTENKESFAGHGGWKRNPFLKPTEPSVFHSVLSRIAVQINMKRVFKDREVDRMAVDLVGTWIHWLGSLLWIHLFETSGWIWTFLLNSVHSTERGYTAIVRRPVLDGT